MPESQAHGFTWENEVLRAYGLDPAAERAAGYTRAHDIPAAKNTKMPGANVSIKTAGGKSVDMGDILRIWDATGPGQEPVGARRLGNSGSVNAATEPLWLCVLSYEQDGETKKLRGITHVDLTGRRADLFGTVSKEELDAYVASVRAIPSGEPSAEARAAYKAGAAALNARMGALAVRPKVDSRSQRRVQCSFPDFPAFAPSLDESCVLFGYEIQRELASGPRSRNRRRGAQAAASEE